MNPSTTLPLPASLKQVIRPTDKDAMYVAIDPKQTYPWTPQLPLRELYGFATRRQCNDLVEYLVLLTFDNDIRPELHIADTGENHVYPPFCRLKYFNAGGDDDPRIYTITGTFPTPDGILQTIIDVGSFIQINGLMNTPNALRIQMVEKLGGVFPEWRYE